MMEKRIRKGQSGFPDHSPSSKYRILETTLVPKLERNTNRISLGLQARFNDVPLPIADYATDTRSVLEQTARVLAALVDASTRRAKDSLSLSLSSEGLFFSLELRIVARSDRKQI